MKELTTGVEHRMIKNISSYTFEDSNLQTKPLSKKSLPHSNLLWPLILDPFDTASNLWITLDICCAVPFSPSDSGGTFPCRVCIRNRDRGGKFPVGEVEQIAWKN